MNRNVTTINIENIKLTLSVWIKHAKKADSGVRISTLFSFILFKRSTFTVSTPLSVPTQEYRQFIKVVVEMGIPGVVEMITHNPAPNSAAKPEYASSLTVPLRQSDNYR
mgnify:CR=1 FL=1